MTHDELPPLSAIDRKDKLILWLATEVLEQGKWDYEEFYALLESHFALESTWRKLENRHAKLLENNEPSKVLKEGWRFLGDGTHWRWLGDGPHIYLDEIAEWKSNDTR